MRFLLSFVVVLAAMASYTATSEAQCGSLNSGFQFGTGVGFSGAGGIGGFGNGFIGRGFFAPRQQPPYFAQFPPVYYSHIVRRPYGISPFAAPPGIAPVELSIPVPAKVTIKNPYFNSDVAPVSNASDDSTKQDEKGNKVTTWTRNPYIETVVSN